MHYYQFNIGDYASHTKGLSPLEDIAYRRLLDEYYLSEQPLSGSSTDVARMIGMREYADEVAYVLDRFFEIKDGVYINERADREIAKYHDKSGKASNAGKASAEARRNKRLTSVEQTLNERTTDVQPTNNQEPRNNKKLLAPPEGVLDSVWTDFVQHRKAIKAPLTDTAIKGIEREAQKAGITLNNALQEICARGWRGFKAEWVANTQKPTVDDFMGSAV